MTYDVFLSYSRSDRRLARRVRDSLVDTGLTVIWTDDGIEPGTPFWELAVEETLGASKCVVVLLSPNIRKAASVLSEIQYALNHNQQVFPLLIEGEAQDSIPYTLSGKQWIDARTDYDQAISQLVSAIQLYRTRPAAPVQVVTEVKRTKVRSKRPAWITALATVLAVALTSLVLLLLASGAFSSLTAPQPTLAEHEIASTLAVETEVARILTEYYTQTRIAQANQTATATYYTLTPTSTYTPTSPPTATPTPDDTATLNAQTTLDAGALIDPPTDTPAPTFTPTLTPSATITATPDAVSTARAEAILRTTAEANARATQESQASVRITSARVNLRGGPGTNYLIVGTATRGEVFPVVAVHLEGSNLWYLVRLSDESHAWIAGIVTAFQGDIAQVEIAATIPPTPRR